VTLIASLCLLPRPAHAQAGAGLPGVSHGTPSAPHGGSFGVTIRHDPPPPPSSNPSGPAHANPLVPTAPPSAFDSIDVFRAAPRTYAPRLNRSSRRRFSTGYGAGSVYLADPFGYISQPYAGQRDDTRALDGEGTGYLRIDVEPDTARVYIDGFYAGAVADFRRGGRPLDAGPHRIEIRADGFDTLNVDVRITANDTLAYRGTLVKADQRADARAPVAPPKVFYVIPGCYAGDIRPRAEQLRAGCEIARLREIPPLIAPERR